MDTYILTFGKIGETAPVPPLTLPFTDPNQFARAVAAHAQPYLERAVIALGRPELADCFFAFNSDMSAGLFIQADLVGGTAARFCPTRIEPVA